MARFYIYEHIRADTGLPFYVGKGSGDRDKSKQGRNPYWRHVVAKAGGYSIARIARSSSEELIHLVEIERIDQYRRMGTRIVNLTDGGEGSSGFRHSPEVRARITEKQKGQKRPTVSAALKGVPKSEAHKAKLSAAKKGRKMSAQVRAVMSERRKGTASPMLGRKHTEESKKKISESLRGEKNPFFGKAHSDEVIQKIKAANIGRRLSDETRARMSASRSGEKSIFFGVPVPPERKAKQIATLKARPLLECPNCGKKTNEGNARRWHFDNCRGAR